MQKKSQFCGNKNVNLAKKQSQSFIEFSDKIYWILQKKMSNFCKKKTQNSLSFVVLFVTFIIKKTNVDFFCNLPCFHRSFMINTINNLSSFYNITCQTFHLQKSFPVLLFFRHHYFDTFFNDLRSFIFRFPPFTYFDRSCRLLISKDFCSRRIHEITGISSGQHCNNTTKKTPRRKFHHNT